jgi:hypothetical protein
MPSTAKSTSSRRVNTPENLEYGLGLDIGGSRLPQDFLGGSDSFAARERRVDLPNTCLSNDTPQETHENNIISHDVKEKTADFLEKFEYHPLLMRKSAALLTM